MSLLADAFSVYLGALRIGAATLMTGNWRDGLKQLIAPVGYWRLLPNAVILAEFKKYRPNRILDVSSPKLPSLILGRWSEVWATDLEDPALMIRWKNTATAIGLQNYHVRFEDACSLSFPDAHFDMVFSISVIEHIPNQGDTTALAEFERVLKPGGTVIVEVPFRHTRQEVFQDYDSKGFKLETPRFYERYYDDEWLDLRLQAPGLVLDQRWILGERLPVDPWIATPQLPRLLRLMLLPLEPWLALTNYWIRKDSKIGRPLAALLVFRKSG